MYAKNGEKSPEGQVEACHARHSTLEPSSWWVPESLGVRQAELICASGRNRHVQERTAFCGKNGEKSIEVQVEAYCCRHSTLEPSSWWVPESLGVRQAELICASGRNRHVQERKASLSLSLP